MANIIPTQSNDHGQLTKPADWAIQMVTAALKFSSANTRPSTYPTPDSARLEILNTLNWYEAHSEYAWPDFTALGFDFSQAMRFRRALVNDVFSAMQQAGTVRINAEVGGLATPVSDGGRRTRSRGRDGETLAARKRQCKRKDDSDTEVDSDEEGGTIWQDETFLAEVTRKLIGRAKLAIDHVPKGEMAVEDLVNLLHNSKEEPTS
ncbi:hypothetical protein NX059_012046 [Plenodomus lindquistii]|nr:hypothetical protein NX059_012046 [Plenodomus lindquistii]